jgi:hypothetical protein
MRTIYIYLSVTGWIWFAIAGSYLLMKLKSKPTTGTRSSSPEAISTEAERPNEQ